MFYSSKTLILLNHKNIPTNLHDSTNLNKYNEKEKKYDFKKLKMQKNSKLKVNASKQKHTY